MTYSLDFAKEMGYNYHLQLDDDALINTQINYNLVKRLQKSNTEMAFYPDKFGTPLHLTLGLCELTRFWLRVNNFEPVGDIFKSLNPPNFNGMTTDGWNRMCHSGYFIIIKIDFWFSKPIQSYLTTLFRSGRDIEGFYTEQTIMNMIKLVFVRENRYFLLNDINIIHDRHKVESLNFVQRCISNITQKI